MPQIQAVVDGMRDVCQGQRDDRYVERNRKSCQDKLPITSGTCTTLNAESRISFKNNATNMTAVITMLHHGTLSKHKNRCKTLYVCKSPQYWCFETIN